MRLLFINQQLSYTSTSLYTLDLALALRRMGDEVQVCTMGGDLRKVFMDLGIETYLVRFNLFAFRKLLEYLREYQPELIHIQNNRSAHFGRRIARRLRLPYVITVHRVPDARSPALPHALLAGVIAANEVTRESLVNSQRIHKSLIRVIPHGVDVETLKPSEEPAAGAAGKKLLPVVGCVGQLAHVKGQHIFLKAARRLLDDGIEAMFAIVGDGEEEKSLRSMVKELRLEYRVTFSPHIASRTELYRIFDIVVVPNLTGGLGLTALEAMAMGKPVVASAVGEILHILQDRRTGLLVPEGDAEALAARLAELIAKPEWSRSLGKAARASVEESFALAPMVKSTRLFYDEVCAAVRERGFERSGVEAQL